MQRLFHADRHLDEPRYTLGVGVHLFDDGGSWDTVERALFPFLVLVLATYLRSYDLSQTPRMFLAGYGYRLYTRVLDLVGHCYIFLACP